MAWLFSLFFFLLCFLGLTVAGQETIQVLNLYDDTNPEVLQALSHSDHQVAVSVSDEHLNGVSTSVLKAESWLRTHVLVHFPASKITTIVVGGDTFLCQNAQIHKLSLFLPSLKNIYYSLTRWGLEKEVKVSAAFSSKCFHPQSVLFRDDFTENFTKPLLDFLFSINSTYSLALPHNHPLSSDETANLVSSHMKFVQKFASLYFKCINVMVRNSESHKPTKRKLSAIGSNAPKPYPVRPTPFPKSSQPPLHSSIGFSVPSNIAKNPLPPLPQIASPPPLTLPLIASPPLSFPLSSPAFAPHPYGYSLPPCSPVDAPAPETQVMQKLWCVAKPSVPADTLQEAMDYACGAGGGDCEEIKPNGSCFYPDTVVAHASYAFNSYWQKNKRNGGTCSFGGTAMIINADPSFFQCRFLLS